MTVTIRPMTNQDYAAVIALWQETPGVGLSAADSASAVGKFLARNPTLSQVAFSHNRLVGAALCGHDGRRGYIHHLTVARSDRRQGIGREIVARCLAALRNDGIQKCHLFVFDSNETAVAFWKSVGWSERTDLIVMSAYTAQ